MQGPQIRVSIVIPTFNEAGNVRALIAAVERVLGPGGWEVIFVDDDSPDGTARVAKALAASDPRVRCLHRIGRRGLSGACIEGALSSSAPIVLVMDGDLQHDESIIPAMLAKLEGNEADLVIGTRAQASSDEELGCSKWRHRASQFATQLGKLALRTQVADPMSGFFAIRRSVFDEVAPRLTSSGFKILLDIITSASPQLRTAEVFYAFRSRRDGASKFDLRAMLDFAGLVANKLSGGVIPHRFALFGVVGAVGVAVHLVALRAGLAVAGLPFSWAQAWATLLAMTSNFGMNNLLTYRDMQIRGWAVFAGLAKFYLICSLGALANVGLANWIFSLRESWWIAGLSGIIVGSVFNYTMSSTFVWQRSRQASRPEAGELARSETA